MIRDSLKLLLRMALGRYNKIVYQNAEFLRNGVYKVNKTGTIVYLEDRYDISNILASNMFDIKYNKVNLGITERILKKFFIPLQTDNKRIQGELVLLTSSKQEYKIFDYTNNYVLTVFSDYESFKNRKESMIYYKRFFPMPTIYNFNDKKRYIIEELVKFKKIENTRNNFKKILYYYFSYFQYCKENNQVEYIKISNLKPDRRYRFIEKLYESFSRDEVNCEVPFVRMHGDLWKSNVLLDENLDLKIIDWERSAVFPVFYDMFTFILNEVTLNKNQELLDEFLNGSYDDVLDEYYKIFNLQYDKENKKFYFKVFIMMMYRDRWTDCFEKCEKTIKDFMECNRLL